MRCEKGNRNKKVITQIVHIVINELRQIKDLIPVNILKRIANQMCEKYPQMFRDVDGDGTVMADGSCSLFSKLQDRAAYLRRSHKQTHMMPTTSSQDMNKKKIKLMSGCTKWEAPLCYQEENLEEIKNKLNKLSIPNEEFTDLMEKLYPTQRLFLNNLKKPPTVIDLKREWPILLKESGITWHFKKLTNTDLNILPDGIIRNAKTVINLAKHLRKITDIPIDPNEESIKFFAKYFNEDINIFWQKVQVTNF